MKIKNESPQRSHTMRADRNINQANSNSKEYFSQLNRDLLPTPAAYYCKQFSDLKIKSEWVKTKCCFHADNNPSLSINMVNGSFKCHSCGKKGHDIIAFHRQRYKLSFIETCKYLGVWCE